MKNLVLTLFSVTLALNASAQFNLGAEIRPRAEFRNGYKAPRNEGVDPAFFIEQRSRLYFNYTTEEVILKFTLQDVRIWGSVDQVYKTDPNLQNVHEAWGQFNFNKKFGIRAGRMELDYDGARFLGNLNWAAQARTHDAFMFLWKNNNGMKLDVGLAYNQNWRAEPKWLNQNFYDHTVTNNYKTMQFARFESKSDAGNLAVLIHNDGRQVATDSSMAYRQTYAVIADKKFGDVKLSTELYYQGGKNGAGTDVSAILASLYATFKTRITPITIGGEYLSGTSATDTKDKSFVPLYGTNHKFYGFMDYFYVGNGHNNVGLIDLNIKTNFKLAEKSNLVAQVHYFSSPVSIQDPNNASQNLSSTLGTEVDLVYVAKLHKAVNLKVGYSQMFATPSMVEVKGTGDANVSSNWAWLMLTFKPTLFESKKAEVTP
jgi:alginate export protein